MYIELKLTIVGSIILGFAQKKWLISEINPNFSWRGFEHQVAPSTAGPDKVKQARRAAS